MSNDSPRLLESLESRTLLATVVWDGGPAGTGTNFHDRFNWAGDALPVAADDAVIPAGAAMIDITQNITLNSLTTDRQVRIRNVELTVAAGLTTNARLSLGTDQWIDTGRIRFNGTGTLGGTGEVLMYPSSGALSQTRIMSAAGTTLTIGSDIEVRGAGQIGSDTGGPVINQGLIQTVEGFGFSNLIEMRGRWTNDGTIRSEYGAVELWGTYNGADLGNMTCLGYGRINLRGTIQNAGQTLSLRGFANGNIRLVSATVIGGRIETTRIDAGGYVWIGQEYDGGAAAVLDGVTLSGEIVLSEEHVVTIRNGLTLDNGVFALGAPSPFANFGVLNFTGSQTLGGTGTVEYRLYSSAVRTSAGSVLTIGAGVTIWMNASYGSLGDPAGGSVVNEGLIRVGGPAAAGLTISGPFFNRGQLRGENGTISIQGTITTANLGDFATNGQYGLLRIQGTLNNQGATINLSEATGSIGFWTGSTILGGTINATPAMRMKAGAGLILDGVTLGVYTIVGSDTVIRNGLTLNSTLQLGEQLGQHDTYRGAVTLADAAGVSGQGVLYAAVQASFGDISEITTAAGVSATLGAGIDVRLNRGRIKPAAGTTVRVLGNLIVNESTAAASVDNSLGLVDIDGELRLTLGSLWIEGAYTTAALGTLRLDGGTLNLRGTLDNTGAMLVLNQGAGAFSLYQATVRGGTIAPAPGTTLQFPTSSATVFDGVTLRGPIVLQTAIGSSGMGTIVRNGLTIDGQVTMGTLSGGTPNSTAFRFEGAQTLGGTGTIVFADFTTSQESYLYAAGGTLTIAPTITIRGGSGGFNFSDGTGGLIRNQGTIIADSASKPIKIYQAFRNEGVLRAAGGLIDLYGTVTPQALGDFRSENGGIITVRTALDVSAQTLTLNDQTGPLYLQGGTLTGTNIVTSGAGMLVFRSFQSSPPTTINFNIGLGPGGSMTFAGDLTLNATLTLLGGGTGLTFTGTRSILGNGSIVFDPTQGGAARTLTISGTNAVLTVGPGITIRGGLGNLGGTSTQRLVNQGVIEGDRAGFPLTMSSFLLENAGTVRASGGGEFVMNSGNLAGNVGGFAFGAGGGGLTLRGTSYQFNQAMTLSAGRSLSLFGGWQITDTVQLDGGSLTLGGTFAPSALGMIQRNAANPGTLTLAGTLNTSGVPFAFDASTGIWNLATATLSATIDAGGGTITIVPGFEPRFGAAGTHFINAALIGTLRIGPGVMSVSGATSLAGDIILDHASSVLTLRGGTLSGAPAGRIVVDPSVSTPVTINTGTTGSVTVEIAPSITVTGGSINFVGLSTTTLINRTDLIADGGVWNFGSSITMNNQGRVGSRSGGTFGARFTGNVGAFVFEGSGTSLSFSGTSIIIGQAITVLPTQTLTLAGSGSTTGWTLLQPVVLRGGRVNLGGQFSPPDLANFSRDPSAMGEVHLIGTFRLYRASYTLDDSTGSWIIAEPGRFGGTISAVSASATDRGTLNITQGARLIHRGGGLASRPTFSNLTLNGDLTLDQPDARLLVSAGLTLNGTIRLAASGAGLDVNQSNTIDTTSTGTIIFDPAGGGAPRSITMDQTARLTIGPNVTVRGGNGRINVASGGLLTNNGLIRADVRGERLDTLIHNTNGGRVEVVNGALMQAFVIVGGEVLVNTGTLSFLPGATGNSIATLTNNGGIINLGLVTVNVSGVYTQNAAGVLALDVQSGTVFGKLTTATANLNGMVQITPLGNPPYTGATLRFITATTLNGQFTSWTVMTGKKDWVASMVFTSTGVTLTMTPRPILTKR
ncbi:MAG: hypothetical protein JNK25_09375 [Phycisphaerae bacterium]|nr:hypothetical protein [Phycisphaerae bacterium]